MATKNRRQAKSKSNVTDGFHISNGPVIQSAEEAGTSPADLGDIAALPRAHGAPELFAIARDPRTIFTYWSIDWPRLFAKTIPVDRQVHLRVYRGDGALEVSAAVEPMAGNSYLSVSQQRGVYRVEVGYYQPEDVWNSVAISDEVTMPPDNITQYADVDLVTIPFHLSFQRLVELFRVSNGAALAATISRFQKRAMNEEERDLLNAEEREILHAMDLSLLEITAAWRAFIDQAENETLRKRMDAILRSGSSSPASGFGESSWSSAAS
jgi:Domain of unknown function (DUF4912)